MERRRFISTALLSSGAVLLSRNLLAAQKTPSVNPFKLKYAIHDGMFKNHAGPDFVNQIKFAFENGFRAIEDNGLMARTPEEQKKIGETLASLGMQMGVFVVGFDNWPLKTSLTSGNAEWREKFLTACRNAVDVAKRVNATWMTVVPGNYDRNLPIDYQNANVIETLRQASKIFEPQGLVMVLEPLSDTPELFLRYSAQTYMICKAVNSPSCKILYDIYHMQRNEGDIIKNIDKAWDEIAYFQIGDNPGRNEPTTGELNYRNIFKHIHLKGFRGVYGMEHGNAKPGKEGELALIEAYRNSDNF